MSLEGYQYETLAVTWAALPTVDPALDLSGVLHVRLNRPQQLNTINEQAWDDCRRCFRKISSDSRVRCVLLTGEGRLFSAGLDLSSLPATEEQDVGRRGIGMYHLIKKCQAAFTAIEQCRQPVIAVVHGGCVGAGVDLISACDIRLCTADAWFCVKEVAIGLAADVGTLQRFPKVVGNGSVARELALTARRMGAEEALRIGFVSAVHPSLPAAVLAGSLMAAQIATHSPVAVVGTKHHLNYSRDHSVAEGLEYIAAWNSSALQTDDIPIAVNSMLQKSKPQFAKL